jgi:predicted alpha/beta superfamily hydrolase
LKGKTMKRFSIIIILLFISCNAYAQHPVVSENKYPKVEIDNTEVRELLSNYNRQKYKIYVKYPRNYQNSKKKYPVLYILDAETNFGGVSYIVQRLIKDKIIPEILLVGIAYNVDYDTFYELRSRDLTPTLVEGFKWLGVPYASGGAENFTKFIKIELFSFVDENYKTQKDQRAIYGHSFGGLFGTYIFLNHTHMFNKYLLLSPSLWWDNRIIFKDIKNLDLKGENIKLYMASGELEPSISGPQNQFIDLLNNKVSENSNINSEILDNETHRTIFGNGFTKGLRFLY